MDEGRDGSGVALEISGETTETTDPGDRSFDDPSFRQDLEADCGVRVEPPPASASMASCCDCSMLATTMVLLESSTIFLTCSLVAHPWNNIATKINPTNRTVFIWFMIFTPQVRMLLTCLLTRKCSLHIHRLRCA